MLQKSPTNDVGKLLILIFSLYQQKIKMLIRYDFIVQQHVERNVLHQHQYPHQQINPVHEKILMHLDMKVILSKPVIHMLQKRPTNDVGKLLILIFLLYQQTIKMLIKYDFIVRQPVRGNARIQKSQQHHPLLLLPHHLQIYPLHHRPLLQVQQNPQWKLQLQDPLIRVILVIRSQQHHPLLLLLHHRPPLQVQQNPQWKLQLRDPSIRVIRVDPRDVVI